MYVLMVWYRIVPYHTYLRYNTIDMKCIQNIFVSNATEGLKVTSPFLLFGKLEPPFSSGLDKALVIAPNAVTNRDKVEFFWIKDIVMLRGYLKQTLRQSVVVLLLLSGVIHTRMLKIIITIGYQKALQLFTERN